MIRRSVGLIALLLLGCGSVGELLGIVETDAGSTGGALGDSGSEVGMDANASPVADSSFAAEAPDQGDAPEAATSAPLDAGAEGAPVTFGQGPFGPVSRVSAVSNANWINEDPSVTGDQLELYFTSLQTGINGIWVSRRAAVTDPWGAPTALAALGSPAYEPCVSRDGLTIWFAVPGSSDAAMSAKLWVSSRAARTDPWSTPRPLPELASPGFDDEKPSVDDAELVMVFMSDRPGGAGGMDIYMSTRPTKSDPWGTPTNLTEVNTARDERDPFIGRQDLILFWAANPPMEAIRSATRASTTQRFSGVQSLSELGVPNFDPALSVDLRHIFFASQRTGDRHQQIYEAFR